MKNDLKKKYTHLADEKLCSILTSKRGEYHAQALDVAKEVLLERGHDTDLKALFFEKFKEYSDEDLFQILESDYDGYHKLGIEAIQDVLKERDYEIEINFEEEENADLIKSLNPEQKKQGLNFKPLLFAIVLLVFNFYISGAIYRYNVTGMGSDILINYLRGAGILHDIVIRTIVIGLIVYYRNKQKGKYLFAWVLGGLLLGAWMLLVVGFIELMTDYSKQEHEVDVAESNE